MARPATGSVTETKGKRGKSFALRFTAYGKRRYVTLGRDGWTRQRAEAELRHVLADVERGIWRPAEVEPEPDGTPPEPDFHVFASDWLDRRSHGLREKTIQSYRWQLSRHLLPHFAHFPLSEITAEAVDAYTAAKQRDGDLGPNQIRKTLTTLAAIMKAARRYGYVESNPVEEAERPKGTKPSRSVVEPEQLPALLDAAGKHRPLFATLAGAGLRVGEACALDWRDVSLGSGTLTVRDSKTEAGKREVDLPLGLREELTTHKASSPRTGPGDPVFVNRAGRRCKGENITPRLKTAARRANAQLAEASIEPISEDVETRSLRRTYSSMRYALGDDPIYVAAQMGHTESSLSMKVYARAVKRRARLTGAYLREFDRALEWARFGDTSGLRVPTEAVETAGV